MSTLALLLFGLAATGSAPCVAPPAPAPPVVRALLPRVIVEGGSGPALMVWLSWSIGVPDVAPARRGSLRRVRRGGTSSRDAWNARLDAEEADALAADRRCP